MALSFQSRLYISTSMMVMAFASDYVLTKMEDEVDERKKIVEES